MAGLPATEGILAKLRKVVDIIRSNGGIKGSLWSLYRTDELKKGELVGVDKYGNKYYQNNEHFMGRNKWVVYAEHFGMDYDGSQVPPEWHRWLHDMCDTPPTVAPPVQHKWMAHDIQMKENLTGRPGQYVPYSTTRPKIEAWTPPKQQK